MPVSPNEGNTANEIKLTKNSGSFKIFKIYPQFRKKKNSINIYEWIVHQYIRSLFM